MAMLGLMSLQEVAFTLQLTPTRVMQLQRDGVLPRPVIQRGQRGNLWLAGAIRAYAKRREDRLQATPLASQLPPIDGVPLRRVFDEVVQIPVEWYGHAIVHLRIWRGPAPEGPRTVVALGRLWESIVPIVPHHEQISEYIDAAYLGGAGATATWFQVSVPKAGSFGSFELLNSTLAVSDGHYSDPNWIAVPLSDLDDAVGEPVEWFPVGTYTISNIERRNRLMRGAGLSEPIEIEQGSSGFDITRYTSTLRLFSTTTAGENQHVTEQALGVMSLIFSWALEAGMDKPRTDMRHLPEEEVPKKWAAALVPVHVPSDLIAIADQHKDSAPEDPDELYTLLYELRHWQENLDETDVTGLWQALERAEAETGFLLRGTERGRELLDRDVYPLFRDRAFRMRALDERYLATVQWQDRPPTKHHQQLGKRISHGEVRPRYGTDRFGHPVAYDGITAPTEEEQRMARFAVAWPTRTDASTLPGQVATIASDDEAVYLLDQDDEIIGLLPYTTNPAANEWAFGYGGGGPGQLESDIHTFLTRDLHLAEDAIDWKALEQAVCHGDRDNLRIRMSDLLAPTQGKA